MIILTIAILIALFVAYRRYYGSATASIIGMDCDGDLSFWTGEPVPHEIYMAQTPWAVCQYHVCLAIWGKDSDERCDNSNHIDCDGWYQ